MSKITIDLELDDLKQSLQEYAIKKIVNDYFDANDASSLRYEDLVKLRQQRLKNVIGQVDWNKLPEEMQRGILRQFMEKISSTVRF